MELTAINVRDVFMKSISIVENSDTEVHIRGIVNDTLLDSNNLELQRDNIESMIMQLPKMFRISETHSICLLYIKEFFDYLGSGNVNYDIISKLQFIMPGQSFLNARVTIDNAHWGERHNVEELIFLGLGIGKIKYLFPRPVWKYLHENMPQIIVLDSDLLMHQQILTSIDKYSNAFLIHSGISHSEEVAA